MITNTKNILVHRFKMLREQRGWSTYELARFSKLAQKTIWKIENEDVAFSLETAEQLARAFGYELWQLLIPLTDEIDSTKLKTLTKGLTHLISNYSQTDAEGRVFLEQMAEREARRANVDKL
jgi:transcriptional regulator with XRE-family HTH domain